MGLTFAFLLPPGLVAFWLHAVPAIERRLRGRGQLLLRAASRPRKPGAQRGIAGVGRSRR